MLVAHGLIWARDFRPTEPKRPARSRSAISRLSAPVPLSPNLEGLKPGRAASRNIGPKLRVRASRKVPPKNTEQYCKINRTTCTKGIQRNTCAITRPSTKLARCLPRLKRNHVGLRVYSIVSFFSLSAGGVLVLAGLGASLDRPSSKCLRSYSAA